MTRVVGIIPSRYASTRLPGKALEDILGKPMVQRVYEACRKSDVLDALYVATDDQRIAEVVERIGGSVIMTSPYHVSGTDRLAEAIKSIDADIVVNIQGDYPFMNPCMIQEGVDPLLADPDLPMATMMRAVSSPTDLHNPDVVKVIINLKSEAMYFSRSLIPFPRGYKAHSVYEHIGMFFYRREFLEFFSQLPPTPLEQVEKLEQLRVLEHGYRIRVVLTQCKDSLLSGFSVDTSDDLDRLEEMLNKRGITC
ncbi:MAG: 3-deoxy-manno-octulosonate cytidylyltransferase [Candidatus Hydrogenedentes bacterium]|nr:3-deoxy-manno-octulosonate cytidylyltransferase [Candidatus Hydrogenedentota bacterium]